MNNDHHKDFQLMIDESLAGAISAERQNALREHLDTCAPCQNYLSASQRVIASLGSFSFEVDPTLNASVVASLRLRSEQLQTAHPDTRWARRWVTVSLAAVALTLGGSFADLQFGRLIAPVFDMHRAQLQQGLLAFWIVPSIGVLLLFPLLPWLSQAGTDRQERSL